MYDEAADFKAEVIGPYDSVLATVPMKFSHLQQAFVGSDLADLSGLSIHYRVGPWTFAFNEPLEVCARGIVNLRITIKDMFDNSVDPAAFLAYIKPRPAPDPPPDPAGSWRDRPPLF